MSLVTRRRFMAISATAALSPLAATLPAYAGSTPTPSPEALARKPQITGPTISLADYCKGDGITNDSEGMNRALAELESLGGGTLKIPASTYRIQPRGWIEVPSNVHLQGDGTASSLLLTSAQSDDFTVGLRITGDSVIVSNVTLERGSNVYGSFFALLGSSAYLENVSMLGNLGRWSNDFSGAVLATNGSDISNITLTGCSVTDCNYGLYQSEGDASTVSNVLVENFTGRANHMDDLGFSAPKGNTGKIWVRNSTFSDNTSTSIGSGTAVGMANATDVTIEACSFVDYPMDPIHIERASEGVIVKGSTFSRVSTTVTGYGYEACVLVLSGSKKITVSGNVFNLSLQSNSVNGVYIGPGGPGEIDPTEIVITGNTLNAAPNQRLFVNYGSGSVTSN